MPCNPYRDTITEAGGTELGVEAVADGEFLQRVGDEIVGASLTAPPIGSMTMWAGNSAFTPSGWLLCDGTAIDPTTYPSLAAQITTTFNTGGEPPGWIRVPDLRARFPYGATTDVDRGTVGGASSHTHSVMSNVTGITVGIANTVNRGVAGAVNTAGAQAAVVTDPGHAHVTAVGSSLPPYIGIHYIIRAT